MNITKLLEASSILSDAIQEMLDGDLISDHLMFPSPRFYYDERKGKEKLLLPQFQITWDDLQTLKENIEGEYESRIVDLDDQKSEHATLYIRLPTNDRTATFVACRSA